MLFTVTPHLWHTKLILSRTVGIICSMLLSFVANVYFPWFVSDITLWRSNFMAVWRKRRDLVFQIVDLTCQLSLLWIPRCLKYPPPIMYPFLCLRIISLYLFVNPIPVMYLVLTLGLPLLFLLIIRGHLL